MIETHQLDLIGRTLGDFEVRERLGTGGMGVVYKAYQAGMDRMVALKVLPAQFAGNSVTLQRFYQEARAAARLDHPNIVRAISVGEQDGLHYFAMEYVEGESLARRIKRSGPLQEPEAVHVIAAVGEALETAHDKGMIHRDVKPENVLLTRDGRVKLADLGLVKRLDVDLGLTQVGKGLGTANYMAPEQFKDAKHADARCDIYALGLTLYAAVTGVVPWTGLELVEVYKGKRAGDLVPPRKINPACSSRTECVILRATRAEPAERYANCSEFLSELEGKPRQSRAADVPTRPEFDLAMEAAAAREGRAVSDVWLVRYFDTSGQRRQLKLRTEEIRQGVRGGRLAQDMRVARSEDGPWLHLSGFNEFLDLVAQLSRDAKQSEMQSDVARTVAALHAGAPLRRRERGWGWLIWIGLLALAAIGVAAWLVWRGPATP